MAKTNWQYGDTVRPNDMNQIGTEINNALPKAGGTMTGALTLSADPTNMLHAATKQYVDAIKQGLDVKDSVRTATTANISLSGTQTVDGVALVAGDRVLVKDQSTGSQNGVYVVAAGAWGRATDADTSAKVTAGLYVFISEGTTNGDSGFMLTTNDPIVLGTTALVFTQFSGAGQIVAGNALTKTGNQLDVAVDNSTIEINADTLRLKDSGTTDAKIGNRTITDTSAPTGDAGTLTNLFSWLGNMIKAITGKSSWRTAPVTTIEALNTAVGTKAPTGSPSFTGTPTAPTAIAGTNTQQIASTAFVRLEVGDRAALLTTSKSDVVSSINELFQSASDGKTKIAAALTGAGVPAAGTDSFSKLAYGVADTKVMSGINWTIRTSAADNLWNSICYGNGLFVAVSSYGTGSGNRVMTSPDGVIWTSRTSAADNAWYSVCYGNGLFVAVAGSGTGRVMTSPDGVTWTLRTSAAEANTWYSVCYGNGLFVAVSSSGTGNRVMTSPDGINWTIRTSAGDSRWYSVCYGNGTFVAVSNTTGTENQVMTSPDGINWTMRASAANAGWFSVCYGKGIFVAVSTGGSGIRVMTSPDGINWIGKPGPVGQSGWRNVCYGDDLFVAVVDYGTGNRVMTSPDGLNWTIRTSAADNDWYSVCNGNGLFVAVSNTGSGNRVMTSGTVEPAALAYKSIVDRDYIIKPGVTWISRTGAVNNQWSSVCFGNGLFVAVSVTGTGNRVMTSPDGISWIIRTSVMDNNWTSVCYGNGLFVAVSDYYSSGTRVMTSPDGISWTIRTSAADNQWTSVCYGNGLFVAVSVTGTGNRVMTSPDGINWTTRTSAADNNWGSVCYGNGLFVAVARTGTGGLVMTSPDGIDWTIRTSATNNTWQSVCYGNGMFVAVANFIAGNRVMTSPDGINWTARSSVVDNAWRSVCYGNGLFVAVSFDGSGNRVMTSSDGINWTIRTSAADNQWTSVCYGNGLFVAVAQSGTGNRVMTSSASF